MSRDRDETTGRYSEEYPVDSFIDAIEAEGGIAGTGEIARRVGCVHDTAYKKLRSMDEDGRVKSRKMGNTIAWTLPDDDD